MVGGPHRARAGGAVTGEAGIGKTRLVTELARRADNAGARVAVGAGVDVGGEAPLAIWQELTRALVGGRSGPAGSAGWPAELGRLAPDLAGALGRRAAPPVVGGARAGAAAPVRRRAAARRVGRVGPAGAARGRGPAPRRPRQPRAVRAHRQAPRRLPVLFVLTRRDRPSRPDADALLADLAGRGLDVTELELGPLGRPEVAEIARSVADAGRRRSPRSSTPPTATRCWLSRAPARWPRAAGRPVEPAGGGPHRAGGPAARGARTGRGRGGRRSDVLGGGDRRAPGRGGRRTPRARHRAGPAGPRRPRLPARAAGRGRPRRPAGPGAHPSRCRAGRRGGRRARGRARRRGRPAPAARRPRRPGRRPLGARGAHARSLGALPEAAAFWAEAVRCDPDDAGARLELAEAYGWSGQRRLRARVGGRAGPARPRRAGRAVVPARAAVQDRRVQPGRLARGLPAGGELLPPDAPVELRARVLFGLAWNEASAGDPARSAPLLARGGGAAAASRTTRRRPRSRRAADRDDPTRPVRRVRGARAARRHGARPRAAPRLRLCRLDHGRVRAGLRG